MQIRWINNPEPVMLDPSTGNVVGIDWDKMRAGYLWDIPPGKLSDGDYGAISVAYRAQSDVECYGFNNESYLHSWRNPEWRLGAGRYLARIVIKTGGQTFTETVQIMNQGRHEDFRLEPSPPKPQ